MLTNRRGLDFFDDIPKEMKNYLKHNGYHFNKAMYEFASSKMYKKDANGKEEKMKPIEKSKVEELLKKHNITLENDEMYDSAYVYTMIQSDFYGKSIKTEQDEAMHIKCMIDDADKPVGYLFNRFYADMVFSGIPIPWEDMV